MFRLCDWLLLVLFIHYVTVTAGSELDFLALTVATEKTDGFLRYQRSVERLNISYKVLGGDEKWRGGDVRHGVGGGHKVNLLAAELSGHRHHAQRVILFTDSYDVIVDRSGEYMLRQFRATGARVLFSAESVCWPDASLQSQYPPTVSGKQFLNSGGFIGFASDLYALVTMTPVADSDDDQLYFTKLYLNETLRHKYRIQLDHRSQIFQNLHGAQDEVVLRSYKEVAEGEEKEQEGDEKEQEGEEKEQEGDEKEQESEEDGLSHLYNHHYDTWPAVVHGQGPSKTALNSLANYLAGSWHSHTGCLSCLENTHTLPADVESLPSVCVAVLVVRATPFLDEFLAKLSGQKYPSSRLRLLLFSTVPGHDEHLTVFAEKLRARDTSSSSSSTTTTTTSAFSSIRLFLSSQLADETEARTEAVEQCIVADTDYMLSVDSTAHLDNPDTLHLLISANRDILAPLLTIPGKKWSNFWGAISPTGYYARSFDYLAIVEGKSRGVFNVPFISECYLIKSSLLKSAIYRPNFHSPGLDPDMAMCANMRDQGKFMYVSSQHEFGTLVSADGFDSERRVHAELWQLRHNPHHWQRRYIHRDYLHALHAVTPAPMPCPDVYWFPVFSDRFCDELVSLMELHGGWSDGSNQDNRLDGGYESVPTRDIHMKQVGFESEWLDILQQYIRPLQEKVFTGYYHNPPRAIMNFVVRYRPDEQPSLRPHHDASTYTVNVALNRVGVDYQGGGPRFVRYNCSVTNTSKGWLLLHPGRLTHYHEGLPTVSGTRYILVSFVDP